MKYFQGEVTIDPQGKGRPRCHCKKKFPTLYTPDKTRQYEKQLAKLFRSAYRQDPCESWCIISLVFSLPIPSSVKRKHPTVAPDLDNLVKAALDAANGVFFTDDKIILEIKASKKYSGIGSISFKLQGE